MVHTHTWPANLERTDACVVFKDLYEECRHDFDTLMHSPSATQYHVCTYKQPHYVILPGKCSRCANPPMVRKESLSKASKLLRVNSLARAIDRSIDRTAREADHLRTYRLNQWETEIKDYEAFQRDFMQEGAAMTKFHERVREIRVAEESNPDFNLENRSYVYDPHDQYSELLTRIYAQNLAACFFCGDRGRGELKRLPCKHAIHDSCIQNWLNDEGPVPGVHECTDCRARFSILQAPPTPLTDRYNLTESNRVEGKGGPSSLRSGTSRQNPEMADRPGPSSLGTGAIRVLRKPVPPSGQQPEQSPEPAETHATRSSAHMPETTSGGPGWF
ncbi:hypothetical protein L207DRAFT_603197 [Hyaloscypha variabilis F]|uniref:RING-type domain-containing protein n=1 Tax=Hyaloscypha variabilis (strain UAMH 11265 / GT02V1 / F) TaxID=1149755 RepID=A0A2J6RAN8_HYAVF|nr:hypothetical protein L207DRAFT_603197 [Hyaloscypha variabilis F]